MQHAGPMQRRPMCPPLPCRDLDRSKPHRFVLLDIPLVIWWDRQPATGSGQWRVFRDEARYALTYASRVLVLSLTGP